MFSNFYENNVIGRPKLVLTILILILLSFGYFAKDFELDASSDTLLLENDPDLKYLREVNSKYGSKDFLVLTYTEKNGLLKPYVAFTSRRYFKSGSFSKSKVSDEASN